MKLAIPVSSGRIATVFDFAHELLVIECSGSQEIRRSAVPLHNAIPGNRAKLLSFLGVQVLICGAISRWLARQITAFGIEIIPQVSGPVKDALACYLRGQLGDSEFLLPGCTPETRKEWIAHYSRHAETGPGKVKR
jgi:predicted Fe-Mo cluster-binding NifX family protein